MSTHENAPRPGGAEGRKDTHQDTGVVASIDQGGDRLRAALGYAARGWPVFPCEPDAKAPLGALAPHGFKDATTNPDRITAWWQHCPAANVAIATGAPAVDVIDVDNKPGGNGFASFNRIIAAGMMAGTLALVRTPSGGIHAYRTGTGQGCGSLRAHFIDFKASGGYVLAPPSTVEGRPYVLTEERDAGAPVDWAHVRRVLEPPRPAPDRTGRAPHGVGALAEWLTTQQEGNRNNALYWAACRALETGAAESDLDQLADAAVGTGLDERAARATIRSAMRRTVTA